MSNAIRIESIEQFVEQISKLELSKNHTRFFRGHSDKKYLLEPSIYRKNKDTGKQELIKSEHLITKDVLTECAEYFSPHDTLFDKLVKMQHYDYPTRLLDISYNALVGLYFAISNSKDELKDKNDGEVIVFDIPNDEIKHHDSDTVAILSALSLRDESFDLEEIISFSDQQAKIAQTFYMVKEFNSKSTYQNNEFNIEIKDEMLRLGFSSPKDLLSHLSNREYNKKFLETFNQQEQILRLLNDIRKDKSYFMPIINSNDLEKVICVKPKLNNPRIAKQQGAFLIFGIQSNKTSQANVNPEWVRARFIIDASKKEYILKQLEYCGISHQTLFPELDKQSAHIINRYKDSSK
ncbi:FRG domain-containing protein [Moraxella boevrei]|uniref:FRG domain-containing protein n=1 Tax=Faucicola boevrei TaxID=346665 RepID=UPI003736E0EE